MLPPRARESCDVMHCRPATFDDRPAILSLLREAKFLPSDPDHSSAVFAWKHERSPEGPSLLRVFEANHQVVGFAAAMPRRVRIQGQELRGCVLADGCVSRPWRRRGVLSEMLRLLVMDARPHKDLAMAFPGRRGSRLLFKRRLGWKWREPMLAQLTPLIRMSYARARSSGPYTCSVLDEVPPDAASILRTGDDALARLVWDVPYVHWRCSQHPLRPYRLVELRSSGQLLGMMIVRSPRRIPMGMILSYWTAWEDPDAVRPLFEGVATELRRLGAVAALALATRSTFSFFRAARVAWVRIPTPLLPRQYEIVAEPLTKRAGVLSESSSRWDSTFGDSDAA